MPHADSALVPETITTKAEFWAHTYAQLDMLLDANQRNWVTNLSNASSLIYNSLLAFPAHFGNDARAVNWCGFYLDSSLFPQPNATPRRVNGNNGNNGSLNGNGPPNGNANGLNGHATTTSKLLLGPFNGRPACQYITTSPPHKARGVCAAAFLQRRTILVDDVEAYPGHIACDGETRSEVVCPLVLTESTSNSEDETGRVLGVLDLDCLAVGGFDADDQAGLENITQLLVRACDW
ncbi:GAF domain-like protein, partial [Mycena filopes]